jgi:hypothetical protein
VCVCPWPNNIASLQGGSVSLPSNDLITTLHHSQYSGPPPRVLSDCSSDGRLGSEASHRSLAGWLTIRVMVQNNDNAVHQVSSCVVVGLFLSLFGAFIK